MNFRNIATLTYTYRVTHPWRSYKTAGKPKSKWPNLCATNRKRYGVEAHQVNTGMAMAHPCAESESAKWRNIILINK